MTLQAQIGSIVDRGYQLLSHLGEGGMGTVFRATQLVSGQVVALKLVSQRLQLENPDESETNQDLQLRLALAREFQTLASLHHPNIIRVLSYGFDDRLGSYFTMELLDSPKTILEHGSDQSEEEQIQLIAQLLRAVSYVHRRGVIHRDIKPGNVLVVRDEVKLLDFGIATDKSAASNLAGTLDYMAPELLLGEPPSPGSDLYSIGIIFHLLLTNSLPLRRDSLTSLMGGLLGEEEEDRTLSPEAAVFLEGISDTSRRLQEKVPTLPEGEVAVPTDPELADPFPERADLHAAPDDSDSKLSESLRPIVLKLLARDPEQRYQNANEVLRDLLASVPYAIDIETAATRESFLQATVFIGREAELDELKRALARLAKSEGGAYLIGGESGVGKSRLISELKTLALIQGCWVTDGQSVTEGGFLYHEWLPFFRGLCFQASLSDFEASLLKGIVPELPTLLGRSIPDPPPMKPEAALAHLSAALVDILKRQTKPVVLILEDLHWGRSESLALLTQIAAAVRELPLLIIGTYRSDEAPALPKALPAFATLQLDRLDRAGVERLSESMLGPVGTQAKLVDFLVQQSEGNVFFLVEIVRALAEHAGELERIDQGELPESVLTDRISRIVERRIDHVPAEYRPELELSAILGRKLDLAALRKVFPETPLRDFLMTCANAAVLESQGNDWRFAHDKLRDAIIQRMEPERRRQTHRQVAETLESIYTGAEREQFADMIGAHFKHAGIPEKALHYLLQAGDRAAKLYTYQQARDHYAVSAELVGQLPDSAAWRRLHVDILIKEVQVSLNSAPPDVNQQKVSRARDILSSVQDATTGVREDALRSARLDYYCARLHSLAGQPGQAVPLFRRLLPVAHEFHDQELVSVSSIFLGLMLIFQGQVSRAVSLLEPSTEPMERLFGKDIDTMRAILYRAAAYSASGRHQSALRLIDQVRPWVDEIRQAVYSGLFFMLSAVALSLAEDWPAALRAAEQGVELGKETREPIIQYLSWDVLGWAHSQLGHHEAAAANRARAVEVRRKVNGGMGKDWFDAVEADICLKAGQTEVALEQAKKVVSVTAPVGLKLSWCMAKRTWGEALAKLGADAEAVDLHLRESLDCALETGMVVNAVQTRMTWARLCEERGDAAAAEAHRRAAQALMPEEMTPHLREEVLRSLKGQA